ncbi:MAG: hypothetical protein ACFE0S_13445 [Rhodospirillales bacterium]
MTMKRILFGTAVVAISAILTFGTLSADEKPFGTDADVAFAQELWAVLMSNRLVGTDRIHVQPFAQVMSRMARSSRSWVAM